MDDLRKALSARIEARPDLTAGGHVFRHCHYACDMYGWDACAPELRVARQRQRTADETRDLGEPPARPARPRFQDFAGIDNRLPGGAAAAETGAAGRRPGGP